MLEKIETSDRCKVQYVVSEDGAKLIRVRSAALGKTQGRYLEDLVKAEAKADGEGE